MNQNIESESWEYVKKDQFIAPINNSNNLIEKLANIIFDKNGNISNNKITELLFDEQMDSADIFSLLIELILYGLYIVSNGEYTIFDLECDDNKIIDILNKGLNTIGFNMIINEERDILAYGSDSCLYRDRNDYYCEIVPKPPNIFCFLNDWIIMDYRIIHNKNFYLSRDTNINNLNVFFISKQNKIFLINFTYRIHTCIYNDSNTNLRV